jgi:hypothetical protein
MDFDMSVAERKWSLPKEYKDDDCFPMDMWNVGEMVGLKIVLSRKKNDTDNFTDFCKFANCMRTYIDGRTDVMFMTFDLNDETNSDIQNIRTVGNVVIIRGVREMMNTVIVKQTKGVLYELHLINDSPNKIDITTSHIKLKGGRDHKNFEPNILLGELDAGSELHIETIYLKTSKMFSSAIPEFLNGKTILPDDTTNASNNGLCGWRQPDMVGKNPLIDNPRIIEIIIPTQLYANPHTILENALKIMYDDFEAIHLHEVKSRPIIKMGKQYSYDDVSIRLDGKDLTCVLSGYVHTVGQVIVSSAYALASDRLTHFTSMWEHPTKKETIIRLSGDVDVFAKAIELAMMRTKKLIDSIV